MILYITKTLHVSAANSEKVISLMSCWKNRSKSFADHQKAWPYQFKPKAEKRKNNHNFIRQNNTTKNTIADIIQVSTHFDQASLKSDKKSGFITTHSYRFWLRANNLLWFKVITGKYLHHFLLSWMFVKFSLFWVENQKTENWKHKKITWLATFAFSYVYFAPVAFVWVPITTQTDMRQSCSHIAYNDPIQKVCVP